MIDDRGDNKTSRLYLCSIHKHAGIVFGLINSAKFGLLISDALIRR